MALFIRNKQPVVLQGPAVGRQQKVNFDWGKERKEPREEGAPEEGEER